MYDFLDYMSQVAYSVDEGKIKFFLISLFFLVWSDQALSLSVNNDEILIAQYEGRDSQLIIPGLHLSISYFLQILQYFCQFFVTLHFWEQFWVMFQMPSADMSRWFRVLWNVLFCLFSASLPPSPDSGYSDDYSEEKLKFNSKLHLHFYCKLCRYSILFWYKFFMKFQIESMKFMNILVFLLTAYMGSSSQQSPPIVAPPSAFIPPFCLQPPPAHQPLPAHFNSATHIAMRPGKSPR